MSNLPAEKQEELFDAAALPLGHELLKLEERARNPEFTGERVAKDRERYEGIVRALAEGLGTRAIARAFRVSPHVVSAIRSREAQLVATEKKEVSRKMGDFVRMGVERLVEEIDTIPIGQLSVSVGIIADKKALLDGDPTMRVESGLSRSAVTVEELRRVLAEVRERQKAVVVDAPLLDSGSSTGEEHPQ